MKGILVNILIVIFSFFLVYILYGSEIISEPIIEGKSIAGLNIGDTEDKVFLLLQRFSLELANVEMRPEANEKFLCFRNMTEKGGIDISVLLRNSRVATIEVISAPIEGRYLYKGKTIKGFSFGDSFQIVEKLYGKPYKKWGEGIYWYKREGIVFLLIKSGLNEKVEKPNAIFIIPPDSDFNPEKN